MVVRSYFMPKLHFFVRKSLSASNLATLNLIDLKRPLGLSLHCLSCLGGHGRNSFLCVLYPPITNLAIWRLPVAFLRKEGNLQTFVDISMR